MSRRIRNSRSLRRHGQVLAKNKAKALTVTGVVGFLATIAVTAIQAPKARDALDELEADIAYDCEHEHIEPPSGPEKLWMQTKRVAPIMAPTVIMATFSTICIAGGQRQNAKEITSLVAAYELKQRALENLKESAKESLGEKKGSRVIDSYYEKQAKESMPDGPEDRHITNTGEGDDLFFDEGTGRWFRADVRWLDHCRHQISNDIFVNDSASANEWAYMVGLESTTFGSVLGWDTEDLDPVNHLIDMRWNRCYMSPWGEPYAVVEYNVHERFRN